MTYRRTRRSVLASLTAGAVALAGCLSDDEPSGGGSGTDDSMADGDDEMDDGSDGSTGDGSGDGTSTAAENWQDVPIEDVTRGETFTISELDQPVLVHTFAIWCSKCSRQHQAFQSYRESYGEDVAIVELNIADSEASDAIQNHAESNGYDWRFGTAPEGILSELVDIVGPEVTSPPQSPVLLVCPSGDLHVLDDSTVVGADGLQTAIDSNC